jgi:hypothetical protein
MTFELEQGDFEVLRAALALHTEALRKEWSRTEDHDYRHDLFGTIERLERIAARLAAAPQASSPPVH